MRNTLFVLALCLLAVLLGLFLFLYNPTDLTGQNAEFEQSAQVGSAPVNATQVAFTELDAGSFAQEGPEERTNVAARDAESFARLWKMAHGNQKIATPEIDFDAEYVVGVFAGQQPTGGYTIEVQEVADFGDTRTFSVALTAPGAGCVVTDALTSPYQLIRVPVGTHYLRAVDTSVASDCE